MADRIKGIVVEIGGDTTGLSKALSGVNREISSTQNQLRDVERLLKLDPTNTQLLEQKQRLLASAISQTKEKLDTLKTAEKQVQEQFKRGEISREQYEALQREIAATAQELERFEQKAKDGTSALEKMGSAAQSVSQKAGGVQKAFAPVTAAVGGLTAGSSGHCACHRGAALRPVQAGSGRPGQCRGRRNRPEGLGGLCGGIGRD